MRACKRFLLSMIAYSIMAMLGVGLGITYLISMLFFVPHRSMEKLHEFLEWLLECVCEWDEENKR